LGPEEEKKGTVKLKNSLNLSVLIRAGKEGREGREGERFHS
jgi:hypothetical protein